MSSPHRREVDTLKKRSAAFLEEARHALDRGFYDVACFLAEQALQLGLKARLLELLGEYPRTHSVRKLLGELGRVTGSRELEEFAARNRAWLIALEDVYVAARYREVEYSREDAEEIVKIAEELLRLVNRVAGGLA